MSNKVKKQRMMSSLAPLFVLIFVLGITLSVVYRDKLTDYLYLFTESFSRSPFNDFVIAENIMISSEWAEIETKDLVKIKGDRQFLSVAIGEPFEGDFFKKGVKAPDGEIFNFEVKLLDEEGKEYQLPYSGFLGTQRINYGQGEKLPANKTYNKVLIRSDVSIKARKIIWTYYYAKDLH